jgi:hypothetical protein
MASRKEVSQPIADFQVVASCDSSGVTFINEETPLQLSENGLYEIAYINISEEDMVSELEQLESVNDDDSSMQSFLEQYGIEEVYDSDAEPANAHDADLTNVIDEEQIAITNDFLTGKMSFQDFITRVEDDSESGMEDSDDDEEEEELENKDDPEYIPEVTSKITTKRKLRTSGQKETGATSKAKENVAGSSSMSLSHQLPPSPVKRRRTGPRAKNFQQIYWVTNYCFFLNINLEK